MDYNSEEYLALFKKIKGKGVDQPEENQLLIRETPNYEQYENLNEVQRQPQQPQNFNMNEFNIETKVNGQQINEANPNGLNQFMDNNLNEVRRHEKQERLNEVMQTNEQDRLFAQKQHLENLKRLESEKRQQEEAQTLNEVVNFKDVDVVTLEMFNKANYSSMMQVANKVIPK